MKLKTFYLCTKCQFETTKWLGKCPECNEWNTFTEEIKNFSTKPTFSKHSHFIPSTKTNLDITTTTKPRLKSNLEEFDNLAGNGLVQGSVTLLAGEPGIGKSTLTLQLAGAVASESTPVLYFSAEESSEQIILRAQRLNLKSSHITLINEFRLEEILQILETQTSAFIIIDSIQVIQSQNIPSLSGSINQIRFCTEELVRMAKTKNLTTLIIGHVNKDGDIAGPRVLEHLVDTLLFFEGERTQEYRTLRSLKNRFGSTSELGLFEMTEQGLIQFSEQKFFTNNSNLEKIGSSKTISLEGDRPLLLEIQALTSPTPFGYPKRISSGYDSNRLHLIIAILQKYLHLNLSNQDIFLSVAGGIRLTDPSNDLAVAMAILSSFKQIPLSTKSAYIGELGLSGDIKPATKPEKRLKHLSKLKFQEITGNFPNLPKQQEITINSIPILKNLQFKN